MKAKKIVAVVMGAALAGTLAIGMSACSGGKKPENLKEGTLNIANYAKEYDSDGFTTQYSEKGFTGLEKVLSMGQEDAVDQLIEGYLVVEDGTDKYAVLDLYANKKIISGLTGVPQNYSIGYLNVIMVVYEGTDEDQVEIYTYDGTKILEKATYTQQPQITSSQLFVGNDTTRSTVYKIETAKLVNDEEEDVEVYVKATADEKTQVFTYTVVKESDLKTYAPEYAVGSDKSGLKNPVYITSKAKPVEGEIKDYEYSYIGNKYTFYKNGAETGSVDLTNGEVLAVMGNSLYYTVSIPVSPEATKGYNLAAIGSKVDYSLYKYDIIENTTTELNYDVVVMNMKTLYNYETKAYDAALISGIKISDDGVAYGADEFTYVINNNFELCYDVTGMISEVRSIASIGNDKYLIDDSVIVDSNLNVLSETDYYDNVYTNEGLVGFEASSRIGFKDLNGKVVIAPEYTGVSGTPIFYGGVAYVRNKDGELVFLKKDGTETKISDLEESSDDKVVKTVQVNFNGTYSITTVTTPDQGDVTRTRAYYSYNGTLLKSFDLTKSSVSGPMLKNGSYYIIETTVSGTGTDITYTSTLYKLV
ncbi:MAG: hypothetical protein K2O44_00435 [Clostridia bacterium]|nr:hypothetical protein [Clostridia bacterium]